MKASKQLHWQHGAVALYAEIHLDVESSQGERQELTIAQPVPPQYSGAIQFAVNLFVETYGWQDSALANLDVTVLSIKGVPGDTTLCAIAYVTFQAICDAFNRDGELSFSFNRGSGTFSINLPSVG